MDKIHEEGTGAVRSADLSIARWDLISWAAVTELRDSMELILYKDTPTNLINTAIDYLGFYLADTPRDHPTHTRLYWVKRGWACLATAIQLLDMKSGELKTLGIFLNGVQRHFPYYALRRMAITCNEGATKYGEHNWLHGFHVTGLANHAFNHLCLWGSGDCSEDHLGHTMWGFMAITHMHLYRPDMCNMLLGPNYTLTEEIKTRFPHKKRDPAELDRKKRDEQIVSEFEQKVRDSQRARGDFGDTH